MGGVERNAFIKINFPTLVNHFPPQEAILAFILAITLIQREGGLDPRVKGNSRYLIFFRLKKLGKPKEFAIQRIAA